MLELHNKCGPVVRIGPSELAFFTLEGFRDIYTKRAGHKLALKHRSHYPLPPNAADNIVTAIDEATHARHRRLLGHAFSEKALKEQEPILHGYVDTFVSRLRERASAGPVDMRSWFNFVIFDITGDLMFGESFGCLQESRLHDWVELLFGAAKAYSYLMAVHQFLLLRALLERLISRSVAQKGMDHFKLTAERMDKRLATQIDRPDMITFALRNGMKSEEVGGGGGDRTMSRAELHSNAYVLIGAGSEEPATHLAGCMYYFATHAAARRRLREEIKTTFPSEADITLAKAAKMVYLNAVIDESFRIYSPFVTSLPRVVHDGGDSIAGGFVPAGVSCSCDLG
jgi:cytochrome P450